MLLDWSKEGSIEDSNVIVDGRTCCIAASSHLPAPLQVASTVQKAGQGATAMRPSAMFLVKAEWFRNRRV